MRTHAMAEAEREAAGRRAVLEAQALQKQELIEVCIAYVCICIHICVYVCVCACVCMCMFICMYI